jgi:hypothetical protein
MKGLQLSESNVSQTIDLEELLGVSLEGERALRLAIAQSVIDYIRDRTQSGQSVSGGSFKPYSKEYRDSAEFQILKGGDTTVNLTLTGSMLADMDVLNDGPNTITIGFTDTTETAKAYNHNVGDSVPARPFFGVSEDEALDLIMSEFGQEIEDLKGRGSQRTLGEMFGDAALLRLLDDLDEQDSIIGDGFGF